jgi:hypothetical protein
MNDIEKVINCAMLRALCDLEGHRDSLYDYATVNNAINNPEIKNALEKLTEVVKILSKEDAQ